jgi:hypothetical protein
MRFELSQQTLLIMGDIHGRMTVNLQQFFSFPYKYDIDDSLFLVNYCKMFSIIRLLSLPSIQNIL